MFKKDEWDLILDYEFLKRDPMLIDVQPSDVVLPPSVVVGDLRVPRLKHLAERSQVELAGLVSVALVKHVPERLAGLWVEGVAEASVPLQGLRKCDLACYQRAHNILAYRHGVRRWD